MEDNRTRGRWGVRTSVKKSPGQQETDSRAGGRPSPALLILLVALIVLGGTIMACEGELEGRVSVVGNEPFTFLALTTEDGRQVRLVEDVAEEIREEHQGRRLRVVGEVIREPEGAQPAHFKVDEYEVLE